MPIKLMPALSGNPEWGDIAGAIEFQSDLKAILDSKSADNHNHSLSELADKSYMSLDDLPDLAEYSLKSDSPDLLPCYILDGIDDYFEISTNVDANSNGDFSIIACIGLQSSADFQVLAAKGIRSSFTGWTLFSSFGTLGFSIGDGNKYLTVSHGSILDLDKIYKIAVSYNNTSKELIFCIDCVIETFDLASLGNPVSNQNSLIIGKNPANSNYSDIKIHSFVFYSTGVSADNLLKLYRNLSDSNIYRLVEYSNLKLALLPSSFGKYYWYDASGCERHATVNGGLQPAYNPENIIIPMIGLTSDIAFNDALPSGYCVQYFSVLNHDTSSLTVTLKSGNSTLVDSLIVNSGDEVNISVNYLPSLYIDCDLSIEFDETAVEADVHIFINKIAKLL